MLKGGSRGAAITPGDPDKSLLISAVRQTDPELKMPLGGKLKDSEVADLGGWGKAGGAWSKSPAPAVASTAGKYVISPEGEKILSFQAPSTSSVPPGKEAQWAKTNID